MSFAHARGGIGYFTGQDEGAIILLMKVDPARWPVRLQWAALAALAALAFILGGPHALGPIGTASLVVIPGVIGALTWRYSGLSWWDIASWTIPLTLWVLVAPVAVPPSSRWLVIAAPATLWWMTFIFWLPPARWYRFVLRKPYPIRWPASRATTGVYATTDGRQTARSDDIDARWPTPACCLAGRTRPGDGGRPPLAVDILPADPSRRCGRL